MRGEGWLAGRLLKVDFTHPVHVRLYAACCLNNFYYQLFQGIIHKVVVSFFNDGTPVALSESWLMRGKPKQQISKPESYFHNVRRKTMTKLMNLMRNEDGATALEYGLIAALIAGVIAAAVTALGNQVNTVFTDLLGDMTI